MRKFAPLLALACLAPSACLAGPGNPLIGSWQFSSTTEQDGAAGCSSSFIFTPRMATITDPSTSVIPGGSVRSMAVTYVTASPTLVAVMTNGAGHVNYSFVDGNHMYTEDAWGRCYYVRAN